MKPHNPVRGEIWTVDFDPTRGAEIRKTRPAVVISRDKIGRLPLRIVVPLTDWKPYYADAPWFVQVPASSLNGLSKDSGADGFQVKSISEDRFAGKLGDLTPEQLDEGVATVALCIGAFDR
jgi:mRNA interferase MazF